MVGEPFTECVPSGRLRVPHPQTPARTELGARLRVAATGAERPPRDQTGELRSRRLATGRMPRKTGGQIVQAEGSERRQSPCRVLSVQEASQRLAGVVLRLFG